MRRISPGTVTVGVIAILLGLVAAYSARQLLSARTPELTDMGAMVVVSRANLPKNSRISQEDVRAVQLPPNVTPKEGTITIPSVAIGRYVKETVTAGEPILEEKLYKIGETPSLADDLPPGYRAVAIDVSGAQAGGGMVKVGSFVDIALTVEGDHPELQGIGRRQGMGTMTLLESIKVLAVATSRTRRGDGPVRITAAVTPEQANELILAQRYGSLSVTLVSAQELASREASGKRRPMLSIRDLLDLPPIPEPKKPFTVEKWVGSSKSVVTFDPEHVAEARRDELVKEESEAGAAKLPDFGKTPPVKEPDFRFPDPSTRADAGETTDP